jgi:hypothetical protein
VWPAPGTSWGSSAPTSISYGGAPRPVPGTAAPAADAGFDWTAAAIGAGGAAIVIVLVTLAIPALSTRTRTG